MTKPEILDRILNPGIVAIIRADSSEQLIDAARALYEGGVTAMEVTMTTPNALQVIADVRRKFGMTCSSAWEACWTRRPRGWRSWRGRSLW